MRFTYNIKCVAATLCALCTQLVATAAQCTVAVTVRNDWSHHRTDEPVVVRLDDIKQLDFVARSAVVTLDGKETPCQLDDLDGDMQPDELVWLADIAAGATAEYAVTLSDTDTPRLYTPRVWAALMMRDRKDTHPQLTGIEAPGTSNLFNDIHMHGSVMESELVGWRIYFDQRQNLDLYGKRHRRIEIPETEFYTTTEQLRQGYGVDVLWAGSAIGCGTLRGWADGQPTLIDDVATRSQRIVAAGPVRTVVEVKDMGWKVRPTDTHRMNVRQLYIMYAGHRDMEVVATECSNRPSHSGRDSKTGGSKTGRLGKQLAFSDICTGVQKVGVAAADSVRHGHTPQGFVNRDGLAASWGCDYPDMGKKLMWPPEAIGLAVCVPADNVKATAESELNYLLVMELQQRSALSYHTAFCADREAEGFHSAAEWFEWTRLWRDALQHPLKVRVGKHP